MSDVTQVEDLNEASGWRRALLMLAVKRHGSLLHEMGVPAKMSAAPGTLRVEAMQFLRDDEQRRARVRDEASYLQEFALSLGRTLSRLAKTYGDDEARELRSWAQIHFVDSTLNARYFIWSIILPRLAGAWGPRAASVSSPLLPDQTARLLACIRSRFSVARRQQDLEMIANAETEPLSTAERILAQLERAEASGLSEGDVLGHQELEMSLQRALDVWRELSTWLGSTEREAVLMWARAEAATMSPPIDADLITLPGPELGTG